MPDWYEQTRFDVYLLNVVLFFNQTLYQSLRQNLVSVGLLDFEFEVFSISCTAIDVAYASRFVISKIYRKQTNERRNVSTVKLLYSHFFR